MKNRKNIIQLCAAIILTIFIAFPGISIAYDDSVALHGIDNAKTYFSIDTTTIAPQRFPMLLWGVMVTHDTLVAQGVEPDFILGISGANIGWITDSADPMVKGLVQQLDALGVRIEACYAAMNVFGIDPETILPEIEVVGNVWVSQIAYASKSKGYAILNF